MTIVKEILGSALQLISTWAKTNNMDDQADMDVQAWDGSLFIPGAFAPPGVMRDGRTAGMIGERGAGEPRIGCHFSKLIFGIFLLVFEDSIDGM